MQAYANLLNDLVSRGAALVGWESEPPDFEGQCEALIRGHGEATGIARSIALLDRFEAFDDRQKRDALEVIARLRPNPSDIEAAISQVDLSDPTSVRHLHFASEPPSQTLLRILNRSPNGTQRLVAMRTDLLKHKRGSYELQSLDQDFHHLFSSWFNRGFLQMRRIDWSTPADTLEKIIQYEAVHEIDGWEDLRRRVSSGDRRLYAFFHPALRNDPLIFVEVAIEDGLPDTIASILDNSAGSSVAKKRSVAVFYSISNCQKGLAGVSFGNFLIKQVVQELQNDVPSIQTFVTLSPVPGLRRWASDSNSDARAVLTDAQWAALENLSGSDHGQVEPSVLAQITARYLTKARRGDGAPMDPVARFHLGNGARLERVLPSADRSSRGMQNSWGVMVNYLYALADIEKNHEAFSTEQRVTTSKAVQILSDRKEG